MARSKVGGAFGMLRGSIGSVTYSTRKNSSGKAEQIARQKAQSVTNPNSTAQVMQRMKLGPAQRFFDAFEQVVAKGILSHSFEAIPYGNASRTHFISLAMKEEAAVYVPKGVDFFVPGEYVVSEGSLSPISYFNELGSGTAQPEDLIVNFNDEPLTAKNIENFVDEGYEQGMQLTLIGAKAVAGGKYEPFATRLTMLEGHSVDVPIDVALYTHGGVEIGDDTIAAIAIIVSKGSQESNDYRSTQKMKFVNGYDSLKSVDALQAAIDSYLEGYTYNSMNSNWYLNLDNGQAFNGRVELAKCSFVNGDSDWKVDNVVGLQVNGDALKITVFTSDGTANGLVYQIDYTKPGGSTIIPRTGSAGSYIVDPSPVVFAKMTPQIAAQGGFTLGA